MSEKIYVPPGDDGDEIIERLIPNLHKIAKGERHDESF